MAKSTKRRKNGKVVKSDLVKRMRTQASYDLQDLMICNVVDLQEITGENRLVPRSLVFNRKLKKIVGVTPLQERAMKTERWRWNIYSGIVCRTQTGKVYLDREEDGFTKGEYLLRELNDYVTDTLTDHFQQANPMQRLTMFWVATPYDMSKCEDIGGVLLDAILAPIWKFNVLGNMLTQYEQEYPDVKVVHYVTSKLSDFVEWYLSQDKYQKRLDGNVTTKFKFEPSGVKMKKGELVELRTKIQELNLVDNFTAFATPIGFSNKEWQFTSTGYDHSRFMSLVEKVPLCLNVYIEIIYDNGDKNIVKFIKGEFVD